RRAGCSLRPFRFPLRPEEMQARSGRLMAYEAYGLLKRLVDDEAQPIDPHVRQRLLAGRGIDVASHEATLRQRSEDCAAYAAAADGLDGLILPTVPRCPCPVEEVDESTVPMSRLTRAANYLDLTALTLPVRAPAPALPVGIQLVAPARDEARLLGLGRLVERLMAEA